MENEDLQIASCSIEDLTLKQSQQILKQWEEGAKLGTFQEEKKESNTSMLEHTLNKTETAEIFNKESILIGGHDVIPREKAIIYLGEAAVNFANINGVDCNTYSIGKANTNLNYLYKRGFEKAVTYYNIVLLSENN